MRTFPVGKLPGDVLQRLLARSPVQDPRVVSGPAIGEDATAIDFGDRYLVAKTDPITFATDEIGWYAVNVNANDIACRGAKPKWFLWTLLLPVSNATETIVERIFDQVHQACRALGIEVVGGHTEITFGLDRPIVVGQMFGEVMKEGAECRVPSVESSHPSLVTRHSPLITTSGARVGDVLLLTKGVPIEGVSLLAREMEHELLAAGIDAEVINRAKMFLHEPGISVVRDAMAACSAARIHAMHDPTEGGLATGLHELAIAASVGLRIDEDAILVLPVATMFARALHFDPLGLIASGALLICVAPEDVDRVRATLQHNAITCRAIGEVVAREDGVKLIGKKGERDLPQFARDEIARLL